MRTLAGLCDLSVTGDAPLRNRFAVIKAQYALPIIRPSQGASGIVISRSICFVLVLLPLAEVSATPFAGEEIARRMQAGAQLSGFCYLEAKINRTVTGEHCRDLTAWTETEFPLIKHDLGRATPSAAADLDTYKKNLAAIIAIGDAAATPLAPTRPSPL